MILFTTYGRFVGHHSEESILHGFCCIRKLWQASSEDEAIRHAEGEATECAANLNVNLLPLFQCYWLSDPPADGNEVFSLIRTSHLPSQQYLETFFDTGDEFHRPGGEIS